jgi:hypothetical protein
MAPGSKVLHSNINQEIILKHNKLDTKLYLYDKRKVSLGHNTVLACLLAPKPPKPPTPSAMHIQIAQHNPLRSTLPHPKPKPSVTIIITPSAPTAAPCMLTLRLRIPASEPHPHLQGRRSSPQHAYLTPYSTPTAYCDPDSHPSTRAHRYTRPFGRLRQIDCAFWWRVGRREA